LYQNYFSGNVGNVPMVCGGLEIDMHVSLHDHVYTFNEVQVCHGCIRDNRCLCLANVRDFTLIPEQQLTYHFIVVSPEVEGNCTPLLKS